MNKPMTSGELEERRRANEHQPVARLVGYPASVGVDKSRTAIIWRGRKNGASSWLSSLLERGSADGFALVYAIRGTDNVAAADHIIEALRADGLVRRGELCSDHSSAAWLSYEPGHPGHYRYPREYMWHIAPGAGNALLGLMTLAQGGKA